MEKNNLKQIDYKIRLLSPVLITSTVGDENISLSASYLSGTSLLGMFASLYLQSKTKTDNAHEEKHFREFFLSDTLRFLNGYPESYAKQRTLPIPLSIQVKKSDEDSKQMYDLLRMQEKEKEKTKHKEGFCTLHEDSNGYTMRKAPVKKMYNFHHKRTNQVVGRSKDSEIFNYEAIERDQMFIASLIGQENVLKDFMKHFGQRKLYGRLGRSKNSQYGLVEIEFVQQKPADIEELSTPLANNEQKKPAFEAKSDGFVLTLLSHAILLNEYGQSVVTVEVLKAYLLDAFQTAGIPDIEMKLNIQKSYIRKVEIENYNSAWKARKPQVNAFQMGSCFEFMLKSPLKGKEKKVFQNTLLSLQKQGVGIRRNEGFGRAAFDWHGLYKNVELRKEDTKSREMRIKKAIENGTAPALFQGIFNNIMSKAYIEKAGARAADELKAFEPKELPPGSQISRLQYFAEHARELVKDDEKESHRACFLALLDALPKTTRQSLDGIRNVKKTMTLWEFMRTDFFADKESSLSQILANGLEKKRHQQEQDLCKMIGYHPAEDSAFKDMLYQKFMSTFFVLMGYKRKSAEN